MANLLTDVLAAAQQRREELLPRLESWIRTNSFTQSTAGVNAMGELLAQAFELPGLTLERRPGNGFGDHLGWRTPAFGRDVERRVVLLGHHDTVFPPGSFEVFERDGDRLRGPGVLDMKGGILVAFAALRALADAGALADMPLAVVSVADEEVGSPDSRPFLEDLARGARAALVFEAGREGDRIITRRKGTGKLYVTVEGRAAHAGNRHADGVSAIRAIARFIDRIEDQTDYVRGLTVNVGTVAGGSTVNTVPAHAECAVDFRFERSQDGEALAAAAQAVAARVASETGAIIRLEGGMRRRPLERTEDSAALYRLYAECAAASGLGHDECPLIGGGSDANTVSAIGVPAIDGLGPRGKGFHTHDEYIEVSSLAPKIEALIRMLAALGAQR